MTLSFMMYVDGFMLTQTYYTLSLTIRDSEPDEIVFTHLKCIVSSNYTLLFKVKQLLTVLFVLCYLLWKNIT